MVNSFPNNQNCLFCKALQILLWCLIYVTILLDYCKALLLLLSDLNWWRCVVRLFLKLLRRKLLAVQIFQRLNRSSLILLLYNFLFLLFDLNLLLRLYDVLLRYDWLYDLLFNGERFFIEGLIWDKLIFNLLTDKLGPRFHHQF